MDEIKTLYRDAQELGAENEFYNNTINSLSKPFIKLTVDSPNIKADLGGVGRLVEVLRDKEYNFEEDFLSNYVRCYNHGDLITVTEPNYGWSGFDTNYYKLELINIFKNL